jgi:hypothetical protein
LMSRLSTKWSGAKAPLRDLQQIESKNLLKSCQESQSQIVLRIRIANRNQLDLVKTQTKVTRKRIQLLDVMLTLKNIPSGGVTIP